MYNIFGILGALGLIFIITGIVLRKRNIQDEMYIIGGILLEIYSIYIGDIIFIVLQFVFTLAAVYDLARNLRNKKKRWPQCPLMRLIKK